MSGAVPVKSGAGPMSSDSVDLSEHLSTRISDQGRWFIEDVARETRTHRSAVVREMLEIGSEDRARLVERLLAQRPIPRERKRS